MTVGVYPGSFDPFTVGHLDVLTSAAGLFDLVYVAVLHNVDKRPTFTVKERMEMIQNVPRVFLPTVLRGCVAWARENNCELITAAEMKIINDKRSKEKNK